MRSVKKETYSVHLFKDGDSRLVRDFKSLARAQHYAVVANQALKDFSINLQNSFYYVLVQTNISFDTLDELPF